MCCSRTTSHRTCQVLVIALSLIALCVISDVEAQSQGSAIMSAKLTTLRMSSETETTELFRREVINSISKTAGNKSEVQRTKRRRRSSTVPTDSSRRRPGKRENNTSDLYLSTTVLQDTMRLDTRSVVGKSVLSNEKEDLQRLVSGVVSRQRQTMLYWVLITSGAGLGLILILSVLTVLCYRLQIRSWKVQMRGRTSKNTRDEIRTCQSETYRQKERSPATGNGTDNLRNTSKLAPGTDRGVSVFSWGSEFDVVSESSDNLYTNDFANSTNQTPAKHENKRLSRGPDTRSKRFSNFLLYKLGVNKNSPQVGKNKGAAPDKDKGTYINMATIEITPPHQQEHDYMPMFGDKNNTLPPNNQTARHKHDKTDIYVNTDIL